MIRKEKNGVVWFEFEKLEKYPQVHHAIFSRRGGISSGPFSSLNFGVSVGDDADSVQHNRKVAFSAVGLSCSLVYAHQVHGARVHAVTLPLERECLVLNCDALITNKKEVALCINHADCQAAIFFDPVNQAIACAHSGWRGSCQNIYKQTITEMQQQFGSEAKNLIVCISPSLGPDKAEFIHYEKELPQDFWTFKSETNYFNFWEISQWQLALEGVQLQNIEVAGLCTFSDADHFFSYRRDKVCGRHLTAVWLQ